VFSKYKEKYLSERLRGGIKPSVFEVERHKMALFATALSAPTFHVEEMEQLAELCLDEYEGAYEPYPNAEDKLKRVVKHAVATMYNYMESGDSKWFTLKRTEIPQIPRKPLTDWLVKLFSTP